MTLLDINNIYKHKNSPDFRNFNKKFKLQISLLYMLLLDSWYISSYFQCTFFSLCKLVAHCKAEATTRQRTTSGLLLLPLTNLLFAEFNVLGQTGAEYLIPRPWTREANTTTRPQKLHCIKFFTYQDNVIILCS